MDRIPVGVLGATGTVGQRFVQLLADHPWFRVTALASSDRTAGRRYGDACNWLLAAPMPSEATALTVQPLEPNLECRLVFSALPSKVAGPIEQAFASAGYAVCTNAAPHRMEPDVPLLIPEVNADHTALIKTQRRQRNWPGLIVASANCSSTQLALALKPVHDAFGLRSVSVVTLQAISGAGYPGVPSQDILGNVIPLIDGEEAKMENEPLKILGSLGGGQVALVPCLVSAQCNRVPVRDGHTECVSVKLSHSASAEEMLDAWQTFRGPESVLNLPSTPDQAIVVHKEPDRPQPGRDLDVGNGMSVVVGRLRPCPVLDFKFVVLGHNTVRGAAGGAIHNAEMLRAQGWLD